MCILQNRIELSRTASKHGLRHKIDTSYLGVHLQNVSWRRKLEPYLQQCIPYYRKLTKTEINDA